MQAKQDLAKAAELKASEASAKHVEDAKLSAEASAVCNAAEEKQKGKYPFFSLFIDLL